MTNSYHFEASLTGNPHGYDHEIESQILNQAQCCQRVPSTDSRREYVESNEL
jgi:hypothetical protein